MMKLIKKVIFSLLIMLSPLILLFAMRLINGIIIDRGLAEMINYYSQESIALEEAVNQVKSGARNVELKSIEKTEWERTKDQKIYVCFRYDRDITLLLGVELPRGIIYTEDLDAIPEYYRYIPISNEWYAWRYYP